MSLMHHASPLDLFDLLFEKCIPYGGMVKVEKGPLDLGFSLGYKLGRENTILDRTLWRLSSKKKSNQTVSQVPYLV